MHKGDLIMRKKRNIQGDNLSIEGLYFWDIIQNSQQKIHALVRVETNLTNIKDGALLVVSLKYHFPSLNNNNAFRITVLFSNVFSICLAFTLDMANMRQ